MQIIISNCAVIYHTVDILFYKKKYFSTTTTKIYFNNKIFICRHISFLYFCATKKNNANGNVLSSNYNNLVLENMYNNSEKTKNFIIIYYLIKIS